MTQPTDNKPADITETERVRDDLEHLFALITQAHPGVPGADAAALAHTILSAGFTGPTRGNERLLGHHLNEMGAEIFSLRDALWMACQSLRITYNRPPTPTLDPAIGVMSNRVITYTAALREFAEVAQRIRGTLP